MLPACQSGAALAVLFYKRGTVFKKTITMHIKVVDSEGPPWNQNMTKYLLTGNT
jgi:hypothetical protein